MWLKPLLARVLLVVGLSLAIIVSLAAPQGPWAASPATAEHR